MRTKLAACLMAVLAFAGRSASAQVSVTATAGPDPGPTAYTTLTGAFTAINAGTHQGDVTISISGNTTETATAVLNNSGAGGALYTSVLIRPTAPAVITGNIVGAVIKLNGADNVTIDGRIGGVGRNLSVTNTSASTATAAIWLASVAVGNGASNNVIRNLELACGVDQQASTNLTYGIIMSGTTISTTANGEDNDNNQFIANRIIRVRYGIVTRGNATNNNVAPIVTDNIVGPASFGPDQIGKAGIFMQADTGALISRNTIQNVGVLVTNTAGGADRFGIAIGAETWGMTEATTITSGDYTVTKNVIHDIVEEKTFSSVGIRLGTTRAGVATNNLVANNIIYNVRSDATSGDQVVGIGFAAGVTDTIVFNTISLTGDMDPGTATLSTTSGNGIRISTANSTTNANLTLRNNSIYLDASSSTAALHYYGITATANTYSFGTGALNNNNYYINPANTQLRTGGLGTSTGAAQTTEFATLANWQTAFSVPQDANSIQADPLFFSASDLHIQQASPNVDTAVTLAAVTDDIDAQVRPNGVNPDIGADEFYPSAGTVQFSSATFSGSEGAGTITITVTRASGANGAASVDYATVAGGTATGGAACGGAVDYVNTTGTLSWADLDLAPKSFLVTVCADGVFEPNETVNLALSNAVGAGLGTPNTAVLQIQDFNNFNGAYNVGSGQTYTSLTNPGGIFESINGGAVAGNVTINIVSDLTGETGAVALNEFAPGFTLLIKPTGAPRTITGSNATNGIIRLNGADNVTLEGSLTGATANGVGGDATLRNLTVVNTNPTATAGAVIAIHSGPNGSQNDVIRNVNVVGQDPTQTLAGIHIGGAAPGTAATVSNNNNRVENCSVQKVFVGIYHVGVSPALPNVGTVITKNALNGTLANRIRRVGIFVFNDNGLIVNMNDIGGIDTNEAADALGMALGVQNITTTTVTAGGITNAQILQNRINGVASTSTTGFSAAAIAIAGSPGGANTIINNMISGVIAPSTSPDVVAGIHVSGVAGSPTQLFYNSIENTGDRGAVANQIGSFGIAITGTNPTVVLRDNIFFNSQTSGGGVNAKSFAIGMQSTTFTNLDSNFNDFFVTGANAVFARTGDLGTAGTDIPNLAAWQAAVADDANSLAVDPLFVSTTNPHLQPTSPVVGAATPVVGFPAAGQDFDFEVRDVATPDIGADEASQADLSVTKVDTPDPVTAGTNLTYTLTVNNAGPDIAHDASLSDPLPAGTTFVSLVASGWGCTTPPVGSGGTVTCSNNNMVPGSTVFTLIVAVGPTVPNGTIVTNTATVSAFTIDPNLGNQSGVATTTVAAAADLAVTKADGPDPVTAGNNLSYTITVANAGPSNAATAALSDTLPAGTTFVSLASAAGWTCTTPPVGSGGTVSCTNPSVAPGNSVFTLIVKVDASVAAGTVLSNTATASAATTDPNPGNESGTATTTVAASADLGVTKVDTPDPVTVGNNITYTITVANTGPSNAATVSLTDPLPAGTTFVSLNSPAAWSCTAPPVGSGGTVSCTNASVALGNAAFTLVVKVGLSVPPGTVLSNTATAASATPDPNPGNESATATTTVSDLANIAVTMTASSLTPAVGTNVTFTITVNNIGPSPATGVQINDLLPPGLTFVSANPSVGTYSSATGVWNIGPLLVTDSVAGTPPTLALVATVTRPEALVNQATKTAQGELDANASDNAALLVLNGPALADIQVQQTASNTAPPVGTNVTFTITAKNAGPAGATGVAITDQLPASLTFVSATPSQGTYVPGSGLWTVGTIASGAAPTLQIVATVTSAAAVSNIATKTAETQADFATVNDAASITLNSATRADMALGKTASQEPAAAGVQFAYRIVVTNYGPASATAVIVADTLPAGVTLVSATPSQGGACTGTTAISCPLGGVARGGSAQVAIVVNKTVGGPVSNQADVTATEADPNNGNNSNTVVTTPTELMDFKVE